ncbi:hypothetical protein B1778_04320 [Dehalococcoides mccartyi]|uniref:phage protein, HK97 family n=1 Tax=Dehalococcoides mccartyi TaxID=61435 RepID=UPI0002B76242|nr:phage protein, HK97 family [Dehalococcoides mccartyi]AGG07977.1 phage protein, HK97 family [Dehalococcoides mccartyi BTF08]AQU05960.1 hypothetical protein B1777_04505 [Dehalococcoides mccartyi]AQU07405.1 hypothetical protein B1778_04320 [Dehalococcoides mccartyi]AQW62508.1 hypothetical protein B1779_04325 [Dehalococcoides mccartyi]
MGVDIAFREDISGVINKIDETARERMWEAANLVRNTTLENLSGPRSGKEYYVPGTKTKYNASTEDEYPAAATGQLRQSLKASVEVDGKQVAKVWREHGSNVDSKIEPTSGSGKNIIGYVGTEVVYGPMLEFGTSKMKARPWLKRSFDSVSEGVKDIFMRVWF